MITKNCKRTTNPVFSKLTRNWMLCFFLISGLYSYALPDFTLTVTKTDATCLGNGTLTFTSTNTTAGSTITYYVYELPDETSPIAVQTTNFLGGRDSGTYKIVAVQVLGTEQNQQVVNITINSNITQLAYEITSTNSVCNDGTLTVNITAGIGVQYEIISGPVIRPLQSSPTFTMLPGGVYEVRAFDNCGEGTVITHTILSAPADITIGPVGFTDPMLPTCNSIYVTNMLTAGNNQTINYPLHLSYLVHLPGGGTQTVTDIVTTSGPALHEAETIIPFFHGQLYTYDLTVTDNCGNVFTLNNNVVDLELTATLIGQPAQCDTYYLTVGALIYGAPIHVQFLDYPAGFDPAVFNTNHPGPFPGPDMNYGSYTFPVPFGHYQVQISDGCGHTATAQITLIYTPAQPTHTPSPWPGCQSNISDVTIEIPTHTIVSAIITAAPTAYGHPLPHDVSAFIDPNDGLILLGLITGNYTVELIDECGKHYTYHFFVDDVDTDITATAWPGCEIGKGAIRIRGIDTQLVSAIMTSAPAGFPQPMPYNVTGYISNNGIFSMGELNPGSYSFDVIDNCGIQNSATVIVVGYQILENNFTLTPHCGSFDFLLEHDANGVSEMFWLQKYDPATNTWRHPATGVVYTEGTTPNATNSFYIQNEIATLNLIFLGTFRIVKSFQTFDNGNVASTKVCIEVIREFVFTGEIQFTGIEKTNCNGLYMDVKLFAIGVPPLIYSIIEKDGLPFIINNGSSNVFLNLEPAIYTFKVQQSCGDSRTFISDVAELPSLAVANQPGDMSACDDVSNDGVEIFTLTDQNSAVIGTQTAASYTITYHISSNDATLNINPLPINYNSGNATIYCRLQHFSSLDCFDITSFDLIVNPYPGSDIPIDVIMCQGESATLTANSGYLTYLWSTGSSAPSITVNQPGQYTVTITKQYPTGICTGQFFYNVITQNPPTIDHLEINDWTDTENSIEIILDANSTGIYQYSIDGLNYQSSPIFSNLIPGFYTVYVTDGGNCGEDEESVVLLNYPKYFTPNGDGIHEFWRIKYSQLEPNMIIHIFDRFGKLITGFTSQSPGWDGKLDGQMLPSTDYWFVVYRQDGRIHRGHFAMKR